MKKTIKLLFVAGLVAILASCGSSPATTTSNDGRPDWVAKMGKKAADVHYEVGYGKMSNYATSQKRAEADARNKIALWLQADVKTVLSTYTQDSGIGESRELIEFMEEVSKQTAEVSLSGAEIEDSWQDPDGGVYVLMMYDINQAAANLDNQLKSYTRNESAAFAEFKAQEAFKRLEASKE
ncbi:hypothetical protein K7I13_14745 [Brucepastera parasyntrophica]|uniref:LPP20 family lipoprotein n=1 Tax=Brucepastera parasyntrophica TaxID=2880008 RepID=UPI00210AA0E6|nr:LPP20 family lipoprotein [Brucepastera parasyntrophica]ULQ59692.1 hypothetical protein K7I13_14745 [Brucepastera parasyntrophica]